MAAFLLVLYISAFFVELQPVDQPSMVFLEDIVDCGHLFGHNALSAVLAAASTILCALSVFAFKNSFSSEINISLPLVYGILVVANPNAVYFSPLHLAALFFIWSVFFIVKFRAKGQNTGDLFASIALIFCSSIFFQPMIWFAIALLVAAVTGTEYKVKCVFTFIFALLIPFALLIAVGYLAFDFDYASHMPYNYFSGTVTISERKLFFSVAEVCREVLLLMATVLAVLDILKAISTFKVIKEKMFSIVIVFAFLMLAVPVIFIECNKLPFCLLLCFPCAIMLHEATLVTESSVRRRVVSMTLLLVITVERISSFIF